MIEFFLSIFLRIEPGQGKMIIYGFFGTIIFLFLWLLIEYLKYRAGRASARSLKFVKIKPAYKNALLKSFNYYNNLSEKDRVLFEKRVQYFINIKDFIPRNIPEVSDEMKALIAASAIQITFGLPQIYFSHFKRIIVYPDEYYSLINKRNHKGEVNAGSRAIVLSWKYFVEGYVDPNDSINLGLHEMAHALRLENTIFNDEFKFLDEETLIKWDKLAESEISKKRNGCQEFFRSYACENKHEFFAVAVENFFERPHKLFEYSKEIYDTLSKLLNQNILPTSSK